MKLLVIFLIFFACYCSCANIPSTDTDTEWQNFKQSHGKAYKNQGDENMRKGIFMRNIAAINAHNKGSPNNENAYKMGFNKFADLTTDEFLKLNTGLQSIRLGAVNLTTTTTSTTRASTAATRTTTTTRASTAATRTTTATTRASTAATRTTTAATRVAITATRTTTTTTRTTTTTTRTTTTTTRTTTTTTRTTTTTTSTLATRNLPVSIDWRQLGYVTPVKDQGGCGSCWAFSAVVALEALHFNKTGNLISLSEQNLVDCSSGFGNYGCSGGLMTYAFDYVKNYGIEASSVYSYSGTDGICQYDASAVVETISGYYEIPAYNEDEIIRTVAFIGPVTIGIDASGFQFYSSGIYSAPCSTNALNHGVTIVGYDTDPVYGPYYIVKNSWGTEWGESGYIKMKMNINQCGLASMASYPLK